MSNDPSDWLGQPEGQWFERKSLWNRSAATAKVRDRREVRDEIAENVAAFANADGGILVLGVEDDGEVSGHGYPEDAVTDMLAVPCKRLQPPLNRGELRVIDGREILVFDVPVTAVPVMVIGNGYPRRVDDTVVRERYEVIEAIKAQGRVQSLEEQIVVGASLRDLDSALLDRARAGAGLTDRDHAEYLQLRRLASERNRALVLRQGAVLLFGRDPSVIDHPNAGIRILRVDGTERLSGARYNVEEVARLDGPLPRLIEDAYRTMGGLIRRSARLHDLFFRETPEYPTFAWQEAIVNAVAHRDYRIRGYGIEVWLYDDRMEVVSPGGLLPDVSIERLKMRERLHSSRNPRITRVLAELGVMREQGEGVPRMFEEMERSWLPVPELTSDGDQFRVVLINRPMFETPDPDWVRHVRDLPITERQKRILAAHPPASSGFQNSDYQRLNGVDRDTAYHELMELVGLGLLAQPEKRGRGARYHSVERRGFVPGARDVLARRMATRGFVRNADYRDIFGVDRAAARRALSELVTDGVLHQEGERRGTRYRPAGRWEAWLGTGKTVQK